jgi:hypothetical protein
MLDEEPPWVIDLPPVEIREPFIRILSLRESEQVVAIVEILSPSNKAPGGEGRELYLRKQEEVLDSPVHLLEIDLLRTGEHTIAAPRRAMEGRGRWDYLVCLHRGDERGRYRVWPVRLRERLPSVPAPLLPGDPECPLDLQAVFERWYDEGAYARRIDYSAPPAVALRPKDRAWASALTQPPAG